MVKLILSNYQAPGDLLMLSAAVRDLHLTYPYTYVTEVRSSCADIWLHNPYLAKFKRYERGVRKIRCEYPLIHKSDELPYHFIHGFIHYLNDKLDLNIRPTAFKGDIHLSEEEKSETILKAKGIDGPFWLINAGGKNDFTIKWWSTERYQRVVEHFKGRIQFVQVGSSDHHHPPLKGVINLIGKTSIRELTSLTYHAQGVLTPVSFLMHLAAAVPPKDFAQPLKPCVVIAGGREPVHWEAYPGHQFIHTVGALSCCASGGCWKSRTIPLGDGSKNDHKDRLCVNVVMQTTPNPSFSGGESLPRCMDIITAETVITRIENYFEGGVIQYFQTAPISTPKTLSTETVVSEQPTSLAYVKPKKIDRTNSAIEIERFVRSIEDYPEGTYSGKGIVICGGGEKYFPGTWVLVNLLRYQGCRLPIEVWHLGKNELDDAMADLLRPFNVRCVDGFEARKSRPCRTLKGWELKAFALVHSSFEEVLLLDADNVPVHDPTTLFSWPAYLEKGAVFWPDVNKLSKGRDIWHLVGTRYRDEPEFESGQILVNKRKCWKALNLSLWLNEYSDFYYQYVHGDKETFHMGFRRTETAYAMTGYKVVLRQGTMYQHDLNGKLLFQHRNGHKWNLKHNPKLRGFVLEDECIAFVEVLKNLWSGKVGIQQHSKNDTRTNELTSFVWSYNRLGFDQRPMVFRANGEIGFGAGECEKQWSLDIKGKAHRLLFNGADGIICELLPTEDGVWSGQWLKHEKMPIRLTRITQTPTDESIY